MSFASNILFAFHLTLCLISDHIGFVSKAMSLDKSLTAFTSAPSAYLTDYFAIPVDAAGEVGWPSAMAAQGKLPREQNQHLGELDAKVNLLTLPSSQISPTADHTTQITHFLS